MPHTAPTSTASSIATRTWSSIAGSARRDAARPEFVSTLAHELAPTRPRPHLPAGVKISGIRDALAGLEPVPTHATSIAGAQALLASHSWKSSDLGRGAQMRDAGVLGPRERSTGIGFVAVHLRDPGSDAPLATPQSAAGYGDVRLWYAPETLDAMTFTPRQHHEMRPADSVARGTVETLPQIYAQRLVDWTAMGGPAPAPTRDALRGWLLQQDQQAWFLLEGQARGLSGSKVRAVELLPTADPTRAGYDELIAAARARNVEVIDRRSEMNAVADAHG